MRHRILTCKNHPNLRWSCKDVAWTEGKGYNGSRSIFFNGEPSGRGMYEDGSGLDCTTFVETSDVTGRVTGGRIVRECDCKSDQLVLAPEDGLVRS